MIKDLTPEQAVALMRLFEGFAVHPLNRTLKLVRLGPYEGGLVVCVDATNFIFLDPRDIPVFFYARAALFFLLTAGLRELGWKEVMNPVPEEGKSYRSWGRFGRRRTDWIEPPKGSDPLECLLTGILETPLEVWGDDLGIPGGLEPAPELRMLSAEEMRERDRQAQLILAGDERLQWEHMCKQLSGYCEFVYDNKKPEFWFPGRLHPENKRKLEQLGFAVKENLHDTSGGLTDTPNFIVSW